VSAQKSVVDDLTERLNTITDRLHSLKVENEEVLTLSSFVFILRCVLIYWLAQ
jgi:hypothetical protein